MRGRWIRKFLTKNPDIAGKYGEDGQNGQPIGRTTISRFLNWPEKRVRFALEQLNAIDDMTQFNGSLFLEELEAATQAFIAEVETEQAIEKRSVAGRLLPDELVDGDFEGLADLI